MQSWNSTYFLCYVVIYHSLTKSKAMLLKLFSKRVEETERIPQRALKH